MIHLSDIRKYERCPALLWRSAHEPQPYFPFLHPSRPMSELCKAYFGLHEHFEGHTGDDPGRALAALDHADTLINARFAAQGVRVKIPLMRKSENGYLVYFVYCSCAPRESEAQLISDHLSVLQTLEIPVADVRILCLDPDYVRAGELDVHQLITEEEHLFNAHGHPVHTIRELCAPLRRDLQELADACEASLSLPQCPQFARTAACTRGRRCAYFDSCFVPAADDSILYLQQSSQKLAMHHEGIIRMADADPERIEGLRFQFAQIMAARNGGLFVDRPALRQWLDDCVHHPITYLDFEWDTYAIPPYEGMRPFDVLCFQFSMDIESGEGAELVHHEFLGDGDCREAFILALLAHVPASGTILVFNMEGAEKLRLRQLARQFPQHADALAALCARMVDLSLPFASGTVHHVRMHGMYSLKVLTEIFAGRSYHELDIENGMEAVRAHRMLEAGTEDAAQIRAQLSAYCGMDTYAEYLLYHALRRLVGEE